MKKKRFGQSGLIILIILTTTSLLFLGQWSSLRPLAQSAPTLTPIIGDILITPQYPSPPTLTPTPIPDYTPPQTAIVMESPPNIHNWYQTPITYTFVATDDMTGLGITWHKFTTETEWHKFEYYFPPLNISAAGVHTLTYYSTDKVYNAETPQTTTLKIDLTAPTVTHALSGIVTATNWYKPPVTASVTGQDTLSGIDRYELNLNNTGWLVTETLIISTTGQHRLAYRAIDLAGNVSLPHTRIFNIYTGDLDLHYYYMPLIFKTELE